MKRSSLMLIALVLVAPACDLFDDDRDAPIGPIAFSSIDTTDISVQTASTEVFRAAGEWSDFYCRHVMHDGPCEPQEFDFGRSMLIGVFWGPGFSGCTEQSRSVQIVERISTAIRVTVSTPNDLGACERLVAPMQVVQVERSTLPVVVLGLDPV